MRAHLGAVTLKLSALTTSTMMFSKNSVSSVRSATSRRLYGSAGSQHGLLDRKLRLTIVRRRAAAVTITATACSATSGAAALEWHQAYEPENCESQRERRRVSDRVSRLHEHQSEREREHEREHRHERVHEDEHEHSLRKGGGCVGDTLVMRKNSSHCVPSAVNSQR